MEPVKSEFEKLVAGEITVAAYVASVKARSAAIVASGKSNYRPLCQEDVDILREAELHEMADLAEELLAERRRPWWKRVFGG